MTCFECTASLVVPSPKCIFPGTQDESSIAKKHSSIAKKQGTARCTRVWTGCSTCIEVFQRARQMPLNGLCGTGCHAGSATHARKSSPSEFWLAPSPRAEERLCSRPTSRKEGSCAIASKELQMSVEDESEHQQKVLCGRSQRGGTPLQRYHRHPAA